ncbi:MAG: UDP-N-acetylmuramoyl-tripeptide--D-alanyl-D-alanine ligase [Coriobacteriales bacterium]|jgi:UDP-N-acetylmuramoyl-tripeptide--D-alanyl-D-alanine ligase|nr:UDP-N-acetylmuramoyl-tripeptide--D-alanyl-D-alanine ligase [Coriobacteriales bacterium]
MRLTAAQIAAFSGAETLIAAPDGQPALTSFAWDSRALESGGLFVALPGERYDGNDFILAACERGAAAILATREPDRRMRAAAEAAGATLLRVRDGQRALARLATAWRQMIAPEVVAITGSSGKTTTRELAAAVAAQVFETHASLANYNNELGVPATVLSASEASEVLIVELAMRGLGQIAELAAIAQPRIGVLTNVGCAHLELLGSREAIARAKAELIEALPDGRGVAILNGDDAYTPFIRELAGVEQRELQTVSFGLGSHNDVRAAHIVYDATGAPSFELWLPGVPEPLFVALQLPGEHSVRNALAAAAVGASLAIAPALIAEALASVVPPPLRQARLVLSNGTVVLDDSYNANPDSVRAALAVLAAYPSERTHIAVLGDMLELGPDEYDLHRDIGTRVRESGVDVLIAVGKRSRAIVEGARAAGMSADALFDVADVHEALTTLRPLLANAPIVLVKASRSMGLDQIAEELSRP